MTQTKTPAEAAMEAGAAFTVKVVSRHRHGMNARAKVAKLQATAPANVYYKHVVDQDGRIMVHHVYCYTVVEPKRAEVTPAAETPEQATKPRFVVNQKGFRYYAVRDTKLGKNVQTICGDRDAEQQAINAAAELNILNAISDVTTYTGSEWAEMGALRDESGLGRQEFDRVMTRLALAGTVHLIPEENQKVLTSADRYNAVHIGGEPKHLACLA